jgi:predicted ATP-dependent endonuclease of OLD family
MGIKSIRIKNLLSFDDFFLDDFKDINCIVGKNNTGKTNLLKLIEYFYEKLEDTPSLQPELFSNYNATGSITVTFDTTRLKQVVSANKNKSPYQKYIFKSLFKSDVYRFQEMRTTKKKKKAEFYEYTLTLTVFKSGQNKWSDSDEKVRKILKRIFPFYSVDTRRLDLYDWSQLWKIVSELKFLDTKGLKRDEHIKFIDGRVSPKSGSYKDYIDKIDQFTNTSPYEYQDVILNYIKVGLDGHTFNIDGNQLGSQSDGTNSHKYLELFLSLMIALTRREYIQPTVYVDEPEIGLHPKKNEGLIQNLYDIYASFKKTKPGRELGRYKTPYPKIIFATHSPNIVKMVIKLFSKRGEHKIVQFSKNKTSTALRTVNSYYSDARFLNVFSDNEARLFFSNFILFVEGETELEIFGNILLAKHFECLYEIDIYRTNEVMLKAMNPENSNLSIPFLVVYDADKMITTNPQNGAISFTEKEVNLFNVQQKFLHTVYGPKHLNDSEDLSYILKHHVKPKDLHHSKISFEKFRYNDFIKRINRITLRHSKTYVTSTTIEGSLICNASLGLFIEWIIWEFMNHVQVGCKGSLPHIIGSAIPKFNIDKNPDPVFLKTHAYPPYTKLLRKDHLLFLKKIRRLRLKGVRKRIEEEALTKQELVTVFRLLFNGKTDTLYSRSNEHYKTSVPKKFKDIIGRFEGDYMKAFPKSYGKTGGWVTSFVNYSINKMERNQKKSVKEQFRYLFPELYDILKHVSSSIE